MGRTTPMSLFGQPPDFRKPSPAFGGSTYSPAHDAERLETLLGRVLDLMKDGQWRTLAEIRSVVDGSEAGISARLRDFRKKDFGEHVVNRRRRGEPKDGVWEYRVLIKAGSLS